VKPTTFFICLWNAAVRLERAVVREPYIEYKGKSFGGWVLCARQNHVKDGWRELVSTHKRFKVRIETIRRRAHSTGWT
jgi:hypothetical protein